MTFLEKRAVDQAVGRSFRESGQSVMARIVATAMAQDRNYQTKLCEPLLISPSEVSAVVDWYMRGPNWSRVPNARETLTGMVVGGAVEFMGKSIRVI